MNLSARLEDIHRRLGLLQSDVGFLFRESLPSGEQQGGPPTTDLAAEPDSTPETPSEKLVPVWIRDYIREQIRFQIQPVWKTIKDLTDHFVGLASNVPPGSESALRTSSLSDKPPFTSSHDSQIPERGKWRVGSKVPLNVYDGDRPVCQCHSFMDALDIVNAMNSRKPQPIGVYDYDSLVACLRTGLERSKTQRIGVYDYDSLVACLRTNFEKIAADPGQIRDPQDMIQLMAAEIQNLRREREARRDNA